MEMEKEIYQIKLRDIIPNRFQPRLTFDEEAMNELVASIKVHGIIQPLVLRKVEDKYEIIAGERRFKAATAAGLDAIPAVIMNLDDNTSAEIALIENIQRKDLSALEEAKSYKKLLDRGYVTQDELAKRIGKAQSTIANKLRLLNLSEEVQSALLSNRISERHARSLLSIRNEQGQQQMLDKIIQNRLTVRQTDDVIREYINNHPEDNNDNIGDEIVNNENISNMEPFIMPNIQNSVNPEIEKTNDELPNNQTNGLNGIDEVKSGPNFEDLLKPEPKTETIAPKELNINEKPGIPKFFTSLEDEETNMNMQESFGEPKLIEPEMIEEIEEEKPEIKPIINVDLRTAINTIRECVSTVEKYGFIVDTEEFDFENMYQIIVKIEKNKQ